MRPTLEGDLNCTQKCLSYGNVPTTSSAAQTAWSARCPVVTPGKLPGSRLGQGLESGWSSWLKNGGSPDPGTPGQVRSDGTRSALPPTAWKTEASLKCSRGESFSVLEQDALPGHTLWDVVPRGQGTSPASRSRRQSQRESWIPKPGVSVLISAFPLGPPPALGVTLGGTWPGKMPRFLCPDGNRLYRLKRVPSPS